MKSPTTTDVRSQVSPELKRDAERILGALGLSLSDGIRLFLRQVVKEKAIPFETRVPNAATRAAVEEARAKAAPKVR